MSLTFLNPHKNYGGFYKGQVHCHSNRSDGGQSPADIERAYQSKGYSFVCLTDHNTATPDPGVPGMLHITSGEDGYACRHHMLVLGINFDRIDPSIDHNGDGLHEAATCPCENIQRRIDYAVYQNAISVLAHPHAGHGSNFSHWTCDNGWSLEDLQNNAGYSGIEICNGGGAAEAAWSADWWDQVLSLGLERRVWGFVGDDCHSSQDWNFNRAWIVVNAYSFSRDNILNNIQSGNFYSVVRRQDPGGYNAGDGPADIGIQLKVYVTRNRISVSTDRVCNQITFWEYGPSPEFRSIPNSQSAVYELTQAATFVRVTADFTRDAEHYSLFSQPLFVTEQVEPPHATHEHEHPHPHALGDHHHHDHTHPHASGTTHHHPFVGELVWPDRIPHEHAHPHPHEIAADHHHPHAHPHPLGTNHHHPF